MCDVAARTDGTGWRGWRAMPPTRRTEAIGDWQDLTHPLSATVPRGGLFPPPTFIRVSAMPARPLNVTKMETVVHMGTHLDSPRHFFVDGPSMESVPLDRCIGAGVVLRIDKPAFALVEPHDLEEANGTVEAGDIVAIDFGWAARWGTDAWDQQPSLSPGAARWLRDKGVKLLAVDTQTPELPLARRTSDFSWPVHRTLLAEGILIAEQLANLRSLGGRRVEFIFAALPIEGSDGSPARVLARPIAA